MDLNEEKRLLRGAMRELMTQMSVEEVALSSQRIEEEILSSRAWQEAESVFLYVSVGVEVGTRGLLRAGLLTGKRIYVPKCLPHRVMAAVRIVSEDDLTPGVWGIPEPAYDTACPPETAMPGELDLILVPCVTAGRDGGRLGHGAGYYDRFLAGMLSAERKPYLLCLCHAGLLTEGIPMGERDVRMDAVATGDWLTDGLDRV